MTLPVSGAISLNNVNVELGLSGTTTISMNQASVRTLFAVPSGAISMSDGYGKANQFTLTISSNTTNANLRTLAINAGWPGTSKVVATINSSIFVSSTSTGTPALTVDGAFPNGVELINNGTIQGQGAAGGQGGNAENPGGAGNPGSGGGLALSVSVPITITNNNRIAGGGGGGGGGAGTVFVVGKSNYYARGGGGGGGLGGTGGAGGPTGSSGSSPGSPGTAGTQTTAGPGGLGYENSGLRAGNGGNGGSYGSSGSPGTQANMSNYFPPRAAGPGGAAGGCITGNSNITYLAIGTRNGGIS